MALKKSKYDIIKKSLDTDVYLEMTYNPWDYYYKYYDDSCDFCGGDFYFCKCNSYQIFKRKQKIESIFNPKPTIGDLFPDITKVKFT